MRQNYDMVVCSLTHQSKGLTIPIIMVDFVEGPYLVWQRECPSKASGPTTSTAV